SSTGTSSRSSGRNAWAQFHQASVGEVVEQSGRYVAALRRQQAARVEAAPARHPFPSGWQFDPGARPCGRLIYLRRTDEVRVVEVLGRRWRGSEVWPHRLVRAELDLPRGRIRFFALRRREPSSQPLLREARSDRSATMPSGRTTPRTARPSTNWP